MVALAVVRALFWAAGMVIPVGAHPLHSALVQIDYQADSQSVSIRVKLFTDDLAAAVSAPNDVAPSDSVFSRYVRGTLALTDSDGRPLPLQWQRADRSGDVVLLRLGAKLAGGLRHARILPALLWERFPDQVNIVRASYEGRTITLLFTPGDAAKTFP